MGYWQDQLKKMQEGKSGSDSGSSTTNNGSGSGGTYTPYTRTKDVQSAITNINNGTFGATENAGDYSDYLQYFGDQNWMPESVKNGDGMVSQTASIAGTGKNANADTITAGTYQGAYDEAERTAYTQNSDDWKNLSGAAAEQFSADYDTYKANEQGAADYVYQSYLDATNGGTTGYSTDVATRKSENLNDPDNIIKYIYEQAEANGWNQNQINDVLTEVYNGQQGALKDSGVELADWQATYQAYSDTEKERNRNIAAGGNGVLDVDLQEKADELYDYLGTKGSSGQGLFEQVKQWAEENGATDDQVDQLLSYVDIKSAGPEGTNPTTNYRGLYRQGTPVAVPTVDEELTDLSEKFYGTGGTAENPQGGLLNDYITEFKMNPGDTDVNDTEAVTAAATGMMLQDVQAGDDVLKGLYTPEEVSGKSQDQIDELVYQRIQDIEDPEQKRVAEIAYGYHRMNYIIDSKEARTEAEGAEKQQSYSSTADGYKTLKSANGGTQYDDARESITKALTNDLNSLDTQYEAYLREVNPTMTDAEISTEMQKYSGVGGMEKNPYFNGFVGYMIRKGYFSNGAANMQGYYSQNQGTPFDMSTVSPSSAIDTSDPYVQDLLNRTYETVR